MNTINLPSEVIKETQKVSEIAQYLWNREWAERNGGNISINLTHLFDADISDGLPIVDCPLPAESAGLTIFVTGTGCYLRSLIHHIDEAACIMRINDNATGYTIIWGGHTNKFKPTSELISHVKIHLHNMQHNPTHKAIVHTHPTELIVMSHHPLFDHEDELNYALWKMCPEIRVFVPRGVYCAPYALPGSEALANLSIKGLNNRDVILWEKHGALATGEDVEKAFDFLDVANKGAKLYLTALQSGFEPVGLSHEQLRELEQFIG